MHEHINYYTEQTLAPLMRSAGGTVLASGHYALGTKPGDAEVVWVMGVDESKGEIVRPLN